MKLRDYQETALTQLNGWWADHSGNPCIVLPTGAGKSIIIAAFCQRALASWPKTRIMIICSQKELVEQDAAKILALWPDAPLGVACAATRRKEFGQQITVASILSIFKRQQSEIGTLDLIIVDEAHLISHKDQGAYRTFINAQKEINPKLRVIGLTATPFRLGHGYITDGDALFQAPLINPVSIIDLQSKGYLAMLKSKITKKRLDTEGVAVRGGEYVERELALKVDDHLTSAQVIDETIAKAGDRKHWLIFCCGIEHAEHVCKILNDAGIRSACVTGNTSKKQREEILLSFRKGNIIALTNANVLTTGFDFPGIDLIVMMRPTMSPGLYIQMAGRGLRPCEGKTDCLVLDFAGNVAMHGPITDVAPPRHKGNRTGVAPSKICPNCDEIIAASALTCPECGYVFPREAQKFALHDDDIMGNVPTELPIESWTWSCVTSRSAGVPMLVCRFYPENLAAPVMSKFYCVWHEGYAGELGYRSLLDTARHAGIDATAYDTPEELCKALTQAEPPETIQYKRQGKYYNVLAQKWRTYAGKV